MPHRSPDPQATVLLGGALVSWASLLWLALLVGALAFYIAGARRMAACGRPWPLVRTGSFAVGLVVVAYAVAGGLARYQKDNFTLHVVQVLLLACVAPPLLAFGAPTKLAVQSWRRGGASVVLALRSRGAWWATNPWLAFVAAEGTLFAYFLTPVYAASEGSEAIMAYCELQILATSCMLAWLVIARDALPRAVGFGQRFALVLAAVPANGFLGVVIASHRRPLLPAFNTLADTHQGGNVLWALAEVFVVAMAAYLFVDWAREEERRAVRADRQLDAALAAARATVEGQGPATGL